MKSVGSYKKKTLQSIDCHVASLLAMTKSCQTAWAAVRYDEVLSYRLAALVVTKSCRTASLPLSTSLRAEGEAIHLI